MDVADQLRAAYSTQDRTHKWWHRVFFFLLDMTSVNMYIIYVNKCKSRNPPKDPLTHLQFMEELCKALTKDWSRRDVGKLIPLRSQGPVHYPVIANNPRGPCVICNGRPRCYCPTCGNIFMCLKKDCFQIWHERLYLSWTYMSV